MAKIADELGVSPADLNPALDRIGSRKAEEPMLTMVGGRADLALLTISRVMPMKDALDILAIIMRQGAISP